MELARPRLDPIQRKRAPGSEPGASFLIVGHIDDLSPWLFQIYKAGNFIEAESEAPLLQIGQTNYGKPIRDRIVHHDMSLTASEEVTLWGW